MWIRSKTWAKGIRYNIDEVNFVNTIRSQYDYVQAEEVKAKMEDIENWEIASSIPDENGNIVWKPFYQLT